MFTKNLSSRTPLDLHSFYEDMLLTSVEDSTSITYINKQTNYVMYKDSVPRPIYIYIYIYIYISKIKHINTMQPAIYIYILHAPKFGTLLSVFTFDMSPQSEEYYSHTLPFLPRNIIKCKTELWIQSTMNILCKQRNMHKNTAWKCIIHVYTLGEWKTSGVFH